MVLFYKMVLNFKFNYLNFFIITLSLIVGIYGDNIKKEDVLKKEIQYCKGNNDCPEGVECSFGFCNVHYFCHNDDCIEKKEGMSFDNTVTVDDYKYNNTTDLILESCTEEARNIEKCFTRYCTENSNCYSNKCVNNTCIVNDSFTTYQCSFIDSSNKMTCRKPLYDSCEKNEDCYPFTCNKYHFCESDNHKNWLGKSMFKTFIIIGKE